MKKSIKVLAMAVACAAACALPTACNSDNKQPESQPDTPEVQRQEFTVTFRNGDNVTREQVESGATVTRPNNPSKDGHRFLGWYLNNIEYDFTTPITGNLVLEAKWVLKTYQVTFNTNGGSAVVSASIQDGEKVTRPVNNPTKDNCVFDGWYADSDCVTEFDFNQAITSAEIVYAKWLNVYHLTFVKNNNEPDVVVEVVEGRTAQAPAAPSKDGHRFLGWYLNNIEYVFTTPITGNLVLEAKWEVEITTCNVTFNPNDETESTITEVDSGSTVTEPTDPIKTDSGFLGWYDEDGNLFNFTTPIRSDITLHAEWTEDFTCEINGNETAYTITNYTGDATNIVLPKSYNGKPVTAIGDNAFYGKWIIKSVIIPNTVTSIGDHAFDGCDIDEIIIPNTVTEIGYEVFGWYNDVWVYCELPQRPSGWEHVDDVLEAPWLWYGEWHYNEHHEPEVNWIEKGRLDKASYWDDDGWHGLSREGVNYCYRCNELTFVYGIGEREGFEKDSGYPTSPVAYSLGGGSDEYLDFGYKVTAVEFADGETSIGDGAFVDFNIDSLNLPDTVEEIGFYAFNGLHLHELVLPSSLKTIGDWGTYDIDHIIIPCGVESLDGFIRANVLYFEAPSMPENWDEDYLSAQRIVWGCCLDRDSSLVYRLINGGESYEVVGYLGYENEITIPREYNGKNVTAVADNAFEYCDSSTCGLSTINCASDAYENYQNWNNFGRITVYDIRNN